MERHAGRATASARTPLLVALPALVALLSLIAWVAAVSRSGFWADDFLNVTHFDRSLGDLSNDHINTGKYVANVFWALGTTAFGTASAVPFLILNAAVFAVGLGTWLHAGARLRWGHVEAIWVGGLLIATAAWYPTVLWSSNIVHSGGFLALGCGLLAHERCMRSDTRRGALLWSFATGAAWTAAVVCDLLYIGLLAIAAYCALEQVRRLRAVGGGSLRIGVAAASWSLLAPVAYFVLVAYPATTSNAAYASNGVRFIRQNLRFYRMSLAPTAVLSGIYAVVLVVAAVGAVAALRRRDWFPIAVLAAAGATALPALVQGQQRSIHYLAMPLLLMFSAAAAGARPVLRGAGRATAATRGAFVAAAAVILIALFNQGADVRSFFVTSPYGGSLAAFRSQVASLTPAAAAICVRLELDAQQQALFEAEMSGGDGFLVPPISAAQAAVVAGSQPCPVASAPQVSVGVDARGDFVASA